MSEFHDSAPSAPAVFYRSYSRRKPDGSREDYTEAITRVVNNLADIGGFSGEQRELCLEMGLKQHTFPSGRAMWVAGTEWAAKPENFYGYYNCQSSFVDDPSVFGLLMELAMCGTGTGAVLEAEAVDKLPPVANKLNVIGYAENPGTEGGREDTEISYDEVGKCYNVTVGDSRQGWVDAYQGLIGLAMNEHASTGPGRTIDVFLDLMEVRGPGEVLKGFGGVANPIRLRKTLENAAALLGKAAGRKLTPLECCLLIDEAASAVVAGNIRRSAGMRQFSEHDTEASEAKLHLYKQDDEGNWSVDPEREVLRMANHTRTWHHKPTYGEILTAVTSQFKSGEGAIQYVPEAVARANADLLDTSEKKKHFIRLYCETGKTAAHGHLRLLAKKAGLPYNEKIIHHRMHRYGLNPCFAPGTMVLTKGGHFPIESLVGRKVEIFDGVQWVEVDNFRVTGTNQPVVRVELHSGIGYTVTPYHSFILEDDTRVEARDLVPGMRLKSTEKRIQGTEHVAGAYLKGFLIGDGTYDKNQLKPSCQIYEPKKACVNRLIASQWEIGVKRYAARNGAVTGERLGLSEAGYLLNLGKSLQEDILPWVSVYKKEFPKEVYNWTRQCQLNFVAGLFDADGNVMDSKNGYGYQLCSVSREFLEGLGLLLSEIGVKSKIALMRPAGNRDWGHRGGVCYSQNCYRLTISQTGAVKLSGLVDFERLRSLSDRQLHYNLKDNSLKVVSVSDAGIAPAVYCCTVHTNNAFTLTGGVVTGQCAEILLKDNLCVAGDTPIITSDGIHEIKSLVGKEVEVWNGESFAKVTPFKTGEADKLYRVEFGDGTFLDVTGAHRFWVKHRFMRSYVEKTTLELLEAVDSSRYKFHTEPFKIVHLDGIRDPMAYTMGVLVGDGTVHSGGYMHLDLFGMKADLPVRCSETLGPFRRDGYSVDHVTCRGFSGVDATAIKAMKSSHKALWEIAKLDRKSILEFIAGLADSDGSNTAGNGIRIYMSGRERAEAIYLLLQKCGIRSSINLMARAGERTNMGIRSEDIFYVQVTDCKEIPCCRLDISKGRKATAKGKNQVINAVYPLDGQHETYCFTEPKHHKGVFKGTLTGQCNLSEIHLNTLVGKSLDDQRRAFYAGGLQVAALLQHHFPDERLQYSRENDPIVAVSFTGLFDFFVETLGVGWLDWMSRGRPFADNSTAYKASECFYLTMWRDAAKQAVLDYCEEHGLKPPNRFTAVQPAGSKSLLTGASSGWHPPKAQRFIRRITFGKSDPLVAALRDYGYKIVPAQSARDDDGNLLDDVNDPRVHEVLVEIPTEVPWANLPGADQYDLGRLPVEAQFGLYMQVQRQYSTHTTSATIEFREAEIEVLSRLIYDGIQADGGYISAALLARFDANATFPRLPFEPIDKQTYDRMMAQIKAFRVTLPEDVTVLDLLKPYDTPDHVLAPQDTACANGACLAKVEEDEAKGIK
jgi:intein/homing endonuclease